MVTCLGDKPSDRVKDSASKLENPNNEIELG